MYVFVYECVTLPPSPVSILPVFKLQKNNTLDGFLYILCPFSHLLLLKKMNSKYEHSRSMIDDDDDVDDDGKMMRSPPLRRSPEC